MPMPKLPKQNVMLFNGAAAVLIGGSLFYMVQSVFTGESLAPCSQRYERGVQMGLESAGRPISAADLQARAAGTDWGLLERTEIVKVAAVSGAGTAKYAMQFDLTGSRAEIRGTDSERAGVGFFWSPRTMQAAQSACLAYSIFVPEGFQPGGGVRLPGLAGLIEAAKAPLRDGESAAPVAEPAPFSASLGWDKDGAAVMQAYGPKFDRGAAFRGRGAFTLSRGKWVQIEQEVVLNAPGEENGILRLWLDGDLKIDAKAAYRDQPAKITSVLSEVVATGQDVSPKAKDQKVSVTPYVVYWK